MALQGKLKVKGFDIENAFVQVFQLNVTPPHTIQGQGRIYASREQADASIENQLESFVVVSMYDPEVNPFTTIYNEILEQQRYSKMSLCDDVDLIPEDSDQYRKYVLRAPDGTGHS